MVFGEYSQYGAFGGGFMDVFGRRLEVAFGVQGLVVNTNELAKTSPITEKSPTNHRVHLDQCNPYTGRRHRVFADTFACEEWQISELKEEKVAPASLRTSLRRTVGARGMLPIWKELHITRLDRRLYARLIIQGMCLTWRPIGIVSTWK